MARFASVVPRLPVVALAACAAASTLAGCGCMPLAFSPRSCMTLPSKEGPFTGRRKPGEKLKVRERQSILPGTSTTPNPPEPAITSDNCDDIRDGGPVSGPDCVTASISCGETVIGHTRGGVKRFDSRFYEKNFCWPSTVDHEGGDERVYKLVMPEGEWRAYVWMDSPCADLDLIAMNWNDKQCPSPSAGIQRCEANIVEGVGDERVELVHQGQATWLLVVEGADDEEGAFALHVMCRKGLQ